MAKREVHAHAQAKYMNTEFHAVKAKEAIQALESTLRGLNQKEVERRLEEFGPNEIREKKRTTTPCNVDCRPYIRYKAEKCVGCPATSYYKGTL